MATTEHRVSGPHELWNKYEYITESQLFREYLTRLSKGRDMHVIITASSETGVGKTTLGVSLAILWDQHGWTADKAAVADAAEYSYKYDNLPPGSVLILDEAEKAADARRGMTHANIDVANAFAAKRFRQIFGILTAPSKSWVDKRLGGNSADYWIQALESEGGGIKGEARVYRLKEQEHYETFYSDKTEIISWPNLDKDPAYKNLDRIKKERLSGDVESQYVHRDDVEELKKNYWNKATKKARFGMVQSMSAHGLSDREISEILRDAQHVEGIGRRRVNDLVNADDFDEVYSG